MAIIKQYDKRIGNTYVYESVSYWDKEKKQARSKRKLIGKIDKVTGEIVPTDGRGKKCLAQKDESSLKQEEMPFEAKRQFYGNLFAG